jgi:hypothetical protein
MPTVGRCAGCGTRALAGALPTTPSPRSGMAGCPGQPLNAAYLSQKLKTIGAPVLAGPMGIWQQLVR